jgi:cell division protein FtsI (penicillin-binding protein 3)
LTVEQVLQKSSNVGTAKIALTCRRRRCGSMFTAVGFGQAPDRLPGSGRRPGPPHKSWKPIEQATMSYGHGISVSLIQMAAPTRCSPATATFLPLSMVRTERAGGRGAR